MWERAPRSCRVNRGRASLPVMHRSVPDGRGRPSSTNVMCSPEASLIGLRLTVPYALFNLTSLRTSNPCTISTPYAFTA